MADQHKYLLDESDMPTRWYNIIPDLPAPPPPPLHPGTKEPVGPEDLAPLVPIWHLYLLADEHQDFTMVLA
jgi:tryptophan synthase beta chain